MEDRTEKYENNTKLFYEKLFKKYCGIIRLYFFFKR